MRCFLEEGGVTSCYFGDLNQWDLNFFNLQHDISETVMYLKVCKGWFCASATGFGRESVPALSWSICAPSQAPQLQVAVSYHCIFYPFFPMGTHMCDTSFSLPSNLFLPSIVSVILELCIPVAHPVLIQKPVFLSSAAFLIPTLLLILFSHYSLILSFFSVQSLSYIVFLTLSFPNTRPTRCRSVSKAPCVDPKQWRISHLPSEEIDSGVVIALNKPLWNNVVT